MGIHLYIIQLLKIINVFRLNIKKNKKIDCLLKILD